jgi:tripeptide aminopeptidase
MDIKADVRDRFVRYVQIDTRSDEDSMSYPSTAKQLVLLQLLARELEAIGLSDVTLDEHGYVTATLEGTGSNSTPVPVIGLLAHVDTSPDVSGANVKPQVVGNYQGGDIVLSGDPTQIIAARENPWLADCIGHDIVTSDGTTLLGADDKAGVAEIMTAMAYLALHPEIGHGRVRVGFTPDEEVGRGTEYFDVRAFGADYAYTLDGSTPGEVEDETFCADSVNVRVRGSNVHPGYAKGKMVNSIKVAADIIARLPQGGRSPETTEGREGYVHPNLVQGSVEEARIKLIVRDFEENGLADHEALISSVVDEVGAKYPLANITVEIEKTYRNMRYVLNQHPRVVECAEEAMRRVGLKPVRTAIRGGTDGARLSAMGLPTPNIFAGGHNFHSKREWVSVQDMAKAVETIVQLVQVWAK